MEKLSKYDCSVCGEQHEGNPSFGYQHPHHYNIENTDLYQKLSDDFCVVEDDYFIRVLLEIPIIGSDEPFLWGVWVTQKKENFDYYLDNFEEDLTGKVTFGWFSNKLSYYKDTLNLKCNVMFQDNGARPIIKLQESDHELFYDFKNGISLEKAIKISNIVIHGN